MSADPPNGAENAPAVSQLAERKNSVSQQSEASQTAAEFIRDQELLEADAREALPYSIESCTKILGSLRQNVFACLTCNPAPASSAQKWVPAGVCYACSISCHGEHTLVEIFQKRNFTCDCGTTRIPSSTPCSLRTNNETNTKGGVHSEEPDANNKYNQNFQNRFCGCECDYDPFQQKGTMFQCLGLGTAETGGCGEDWYHPGCLVGMGPNWFEKMPNSKKDAKPSTEAPGAPLTTIKEDVENKPDGEAPNADQQADAENDDDEPPNPPGFPEEDEFEGFLCYKCVAANPWVKSYVGTSGFLPPVFLNQPTPAEKPEEEGTSKKRKADDETPGDEEPVKRAKTEEPSTDVSADANPTQQATTDATDKGTVPSGCKRVNLPTPPSEPFSLFFKEGFRDQFCRCSSCYRKLNDHPQLLEEEEVYEPPLSEDGESQHGGSTKGSGSLLERGESALRNVDRVRAIEGVMAYNHLKEKLKPFFQQFADSGQAIGAEDIKTYFAKLRGDEEGIKQAGEAAASSKDEQGGGDGSRREQSGY
uniref:UBR-type domain-containing protein n=1 Tax=Bionectria ochroleuca TaxID=29856 RepID=A0A8H7TQL6_BIOOC